MLASQAASARLLALYSDGDGALADTIATMSGRHGEGGGDLLSQFSTKLGEVAGYHRKYSAGADWASTSAAAGAGAADGAHAHRPATALAAAAVIDSFSAEELFGKYVDMAPLFEQWANLPGVKEARAAVAAGARGEPAGVVSPSAPIAPTLARQDYVGYLKRFNESHLALPQRTRFSRQYRKYVGDLAEYLLVFFSKTNPLVEPGEVLEAITRDFEEAWTAGGGQAVWEPQAAADAAAAAAGGAADGEKAAAGEPVVPLDLTTFASVDDLAAALAGESGTEAAAALAATAQLRCRGLKVGGSVEERVQRLWSVRGFERSDWPKRILAVPAKTAAAASPATAGTTAAGAAHPPAAQSALTAPAASASASASVDPALAVLKRAIVIVSPVDFGTAALAARGLLHPTASSSSAATAPTGAARYALVAWLEHAVLRMGDLLRDTLNATRRRLEKRQTRTRDEAEADRAAELEEVTGASKSASSSSSSGSSSSGGGAAIGPSGADEDDEDDKPIYNPLNLPLGWDGKPMPFWLWKLQGLNIEYTCEICGGASYMGRRTFDRHFQEWKHAHGMRSLGIPNTKHFHDVTRIADAVALYGRIKGQVEAETFHADAEEEYEDSLGNVLNRRTYEDLARAGLL